MFVNERRRQGLASPRVPDTRALIFSRDRVENVRLSKSDGKRLAAIRILAQQVSDVRRGMVRCRNCKQHFGIDLRI